MIVPGRLPSKDPTTRRKFYVPPGPRAPGCCCVGSQKPVTHVPLGSRTPGSHGTMADPSRVPRDGISDLGFFFMVQAAAAVSSHSPHPCTVIPFQVATHDTPCHMANFQSPLLNLIKYYPQKIHSEKTFFFFEKMD